MGRVKRIATPEGGEKEDGPMDIWEQILVMLDRLAIGLGSSPELARGRVTLGLCALFAALAFGSILLEERKRDTWPRRNGRRRR